MYLFLLCRIFIYYECFLLQILYILSKSTFSVLLFLLSFIHAFSVVFLSLNTSCWTIHPLACLHFFLLYFLKIIYSMPFFAIICYLFFIKKKNFTCQPFFSFLLSFLLGWPLCSDVISVFLKVFYFGLLTYSKLLYLILIILAYVHL